MTIYAVQKLCYVGRETAWADVTEWCEYRPTIAAALDRFVADYPDRAFRIAEHDVPESFADDLLSAVRSAYRSGGSSNPLAFASSASA